MSGIRVAMLAPPWLPVPPVGYGGIEYVLHALVPELRKQGVYVELFTVSESSLKADKNHWLYKNGQYHHIHKPQYDSLPLSAAHILHALNIIKANGKFDVIHDHNGFLGPVSLSTTGDDIPPVVHTLHGPPFSSEQSLAMDVPDNLPMYRELGKTNKVYFVGISEAMMKQAPKELSPQVLPVVYNALLLEDYPYEADKEDYFITLARFNPDKGQHIAVRACRELGYPLKMAGVVGDLNNSRQVLFELANPLSLYRSLPDFRYYSDLIFPYLEEGKIDYVGEVSGERKLRFMSRARGLLFPIQWEEPFGMAVIEALACGTPVVAMARGAMPEIIKHGYNGFLAKNETEFKKYMKRIAEIDPKNCRQTVEENFSAHCMAERYLERYKTVIERHKAKKALR